VEAVILAGGIGARLRSEVADLPKILAPVRRRPFIFYVLDFLRQSGITKFILATGYLHERIEDVIGDSHLGCPVAYSREMEPLGTGGAVLKALRLVDREHVFVLNGDTLFEVPLNDMAERHLATHSNLTMALKQVKRADRYGTVTLAEDGRVVDFVEKRAVEAGLINGGIYLIARTLLEDLKLPERFSFEEDFLKPFVRKIRVHGFVSDGYFIDIGIPEDYRRAQLELGR
jgi:D-glycero-alpha-D-manno-heptose 1-phosphate guanylyltransferase